MPVTVRKRGGRFQVVEAKTGKKAKTAKKGGFASKRKALAQAAAINAALT